MCLYTLTATKNKKYNLSKYTHIMLPSCVKISHSQIDIIYQTFFYFRLQLKQHLKYQWWNDYDSTGLRQSDNTYLSFYLNTAAVGNHSIRYFFDIELVKGNIQ